MTFYEGKVSRSFCSLWLILCQGSVTQIICSSVCNPWSHFNLNILQEQAIDPLCREPVAGEWRGCNIPSTRGLWQILSPAKNISDHLRRGVFTQNFNKETRDICYCLRLYTFLWLNYWVCTLHCIAVCECLVSLILYLSFCCIPINKCLDRQRSEMCMKISLGQKWWQSIETTMT